MLELVASTSASYNSPKVQETVMFFMSVSDVVVESEQVPWSTEAVPLCGPAFSQYLFLAPVSHVWVSW